MVGDVIHRQNQPGERAIWLVVAVSRADACMSIWPVGHVNCQNLDDAKAAG